MTIRHNRSRSGIKVLCGVGLMALSAEAARADSAKDVNVVNTPSVTVANQPTVHVAAGAAVAIAGTPTVLVGNTAASPVVTRDADRVVEQPVMISGSPITLPPGTGAQTSSLLLTSSTFTLVGAVPAGQRLTAKFLSAEITVPAGQYVDLTLSSKLGNASLGQPIALPTPKTIAGLDVYRISQPVLVFVDPEGTVDVFVTRAPTTGTASAIVTLTGYLVDVP